MDTAKKVKVFNSLEEAQQNCGFEAAEPQTRSLESILALTRLKLDNAIQAILAESGLPLYLFDYLISSVQNDIRKADADVLRMDLGNQQLPADIQETEK